MFFAIDRHEYPDVLSVYVQCTADRHRVDRVILPVNEPWLAHDAVYRYVEAMIILRREPEDAQCAPNVSACEFWVRITKQPLRVKLSSLDPDFLRFGDLIEYNGATVGGARNDLRPVRCRAGARIGFEGTVEELVKIFELRYFESDLVHV